VTAALYLTLAAIQLQKKGGIYLSAERFKRLACFLNTQPIPLPEFKARSRWCESHLRSSARPDLPHPPGRTTQVAQHLALPQPSPRRHSSRALSDHCPSRLQPNPTENENHTHSKRLSTWLQKCFNCSCAHSKNYSPINYTQNYNLVKVFLRFPTEQVTGCKGHHKALEKLKSV